MRLSIPDVHPGDLGSTVRVVLRDTSQADALHPSVAEATGTVGENGVSEVVVEIPDGALQPRNRYSLWAHVDHRGRGVMERGDLIITEDVPVSTEDVGEDAPTIEVGLTRI